MTSFVLTMNGVVLKMTGFVLNMTGFVFIVCSKAPEKLSIFDKIDSENALFLCLCTFQLTTNLACKMPVYFRVILDMTISGEIVKFSNWEDLNYAVYWLY